MTSAGSADATPHAPLPANALASGAPSQSPVGVAAGDVSAPLPAQPTPPPAAAQPPIAGASQPLGEQPLHSPSPAQHAGAQAHPAPAAQAAAAPHPATAAPTAHHPAAPLAAGTPSSWVSRIAVVTAALALIGVAMVWQKLSHIQEQLARQSTDAIKLSAAAAASAKEAETLTRDTAARIAATEARLSEVSLQRSQLDDLMQSLSRSRDENLVVDIESALRLAQQQAQLAGSVEPLLATLKSAEQRVNRAAQPRLAPLQRAIARDLSKVRAATVTDTASLLSRLDEMVRLVDDLPLANMVAPVSPGLSYAPVTPKPGASAAKPGEPHSAWQAWLAQSGVVVWSELRNLLRVSRIANPEAALLTPDQSFFLRENLKLKLLNARLALLSRQLDSARSDVANAQLLVFKYFDGNARRTTALTDLLQQTQSQMKTLELPRIDDTLTALTTAASGR